jgi:glutaminyl-peptide cyclotransferase
VDLNRVDGDRMLADVHRLCEFGPRPAGSRAGRRQREFLAGHFRDCGAAVEFQPFVALDPLGGMPRACANLIASWGAGHPARRLIGAHGDTRPWSECDPDPARRRESFLGANDGASGIAVLMELARLLGAGGLPGRGAVLAAFDAEELVYDEAGDYCLGSRHYAAALDPAATPEGAIVVDMVGAPDTHFDRELYGYLSAPGLVEDVWSLAGELGVPGFRDDLGRAVEDDHLPLLHAGIPAALVIGFDDPRWHTTGDVPGRCSADRLAGVARVCAAWLGAV